MRKYRGRKDKPMNPTERYGARRIAKIYPTRTGIRHILAGSSRISQYFWPRAPPFPNNQLRKMGITKLPQTKRETAEPHEAIRNAEI